MRKLIVAIWASALACTAMPALADELYNEMNVKPLTEAQTKQLRAEREAAKAKWASMTQAEKDATIKSMPAKRLADLNPVELFAANDDLQAMTKAETAQAKAEADAANAKWAKMTPEEKAAARKALQQKRLADLTDMERVTENDDMMRFMTY